MVATLEKGSINGVERQITSALTRTLRKQLTGSLIGLTVRLLHSKTPFSTYVLEMKGGNVVEFHEVQTWRWTQSVQYRIQGMQWRNALNEPDVRNEDYSDRVKEWDSQCAIFLERFVSVDAAKEFRECKPLLEDALSGEMPPEPPDLLPDGKPNLGKLLFRELRVPPNLGSYLEEHLKILEKHEKSAMPYF